MDANRRLLVAGIVAGQVLTASCASVNPSARTTSPLSPELSQAMAIRAPQTFSAQQASRNAARSVQAIVEVPGGGVTTAKPTAAYTTFGTADPATGSANRLSFKALDVGKALPGADHIWFDPAKPFSLSFVSGSTFAVSDADARDGQATILLPEGAYGLFGRTSGKPSGQVQVNDPLFFANGVLAASAGKEPWKSLGVHQLPLSSALGLGDFRLNFTSLGVSAFVVELDTLTGTVPPPLPPPSPPKIWALNGPDQVLPTKTGAITATVTGTADPLTYVWETVLPDLTTDASNPLGGDTAVWKAPRLVGTYGVNLRVESPYYVTTAQGYLSIKVPNVPPEVTLAQQDGTPVPDVVDPGKTLQLAAAGSDDNGDPIAWSWSSQGGVLGQVSGASASLTVPIAAGTCSITVRADDGHEGVTEQTRTITVPNLPPEVQLLSAREGGVLPGSVNPGEPVDILGTATDPNEDPLNWGWTTTGGALSSSEGTAIRWTTPLMSGSYTVTARVDDGHGGVTEKSHQLAVANLPPMLSIWLSSGAVVPTVVQAGQVLSLRALVTDPNQDAVTWQWSASAGTFGTPLTADTTWQAPTGGGDVTLIVTVDDQHGGVAIAQATLMVVVPPPPLPTPPCEDFSDGASGWGFLGDVNKDGLQVSDTGGFNGSRCIKLVDHGDGAWMYFVAPSSYNGNHSNLYGKNVYYKQLVTNPQADAQVNREDFYLIGSHYVLYYNTDRRPYSEHWDPYFVIPLAPTSSWWNATTNAHPTEAEFKDVLSNITGIRIRAEFWSGASDGSKLDDFCFGY